MPIEPKQSASAGNSGRPVGRPKQSAGAGSSDLSTRDKILHEAKQLFMKKGFSAVSITDITQAAAITKPTLYYYFKDKETLFAVVLVEMMHRARFFIDEGMKGPKSLEDKLACEVRGFLENSPTCLAAMLKEAAENLKPEHLEGVLQAYAHNIIEPFAAMFRQAMAEGSIIEADAEMLTQMLLGSLDAVTLKQTLLHGRQFDFEATSHELVGLMMQALRKKAS